MLKNHVHGLQISAALRAAKPDTRTILMTGFASRDLRAQAAAGRLTFIEKPFAPDELAASVAFAPPVPQYLQTRIAFGVITVAPNGLILTASPRARQMLATTSGASALKLDQIFGADALALIDAWCEDFCSVEPLAVTRVRWWVGARRTPDGTILVLLPDRKRFMRLDERVLLLLDRTLPESTGAHPKIRAIVVDDAPLANAPYLDHLERMGCVCYKAETSELALKLLQAEPGIDVVVIDKETVGSGLPVLVAELQRVRPGLRLVGVSTELNSQLDFLATGVERFLQKPWKVGHLFHILEE